MAKQRYVNTRFWSDGYISSLKYTQRYLFLYFLTNEHTNIGGIYELPLKTISFETDLPSKTILEAIEAFTRSGKIYYIDGWVYVKNFSKHQAVNEKTKIGIENSLKEVAPHVLAKVKDIDMGSDTPSMEYELSKSKCRSKSKPKESDTPSPGEKMRKFIESEEEQERVIMALIAKGFNQALVTAEIKKFLSYWTELNKSGTKQRWELQEVFDVGKRLTTWFSRIRGDNKQVYKV